MRRYCNAGELISEAIRSYRDDVRSHAFPADADSYHLPREAQALGEAAHDDPAPGRK